MKRASPEKHVSHVVDESAREIGKSLDEEKVVEQYHVIEGNHVEHEVSAAQCAHHHVDLLQFNRNGSCQGHQRVQRVAAGQLIVELMTFNA